MTLRLRALFCALTPLLALPLLATPSSAQPAACATNPNGLGITRTVEIDTTGGPAFGLEQYKLHDFLQPNEIVTHILVPNSLLAARSVYLKFREKSSMDWAMSACAVALQLSGGRVVDSRIVLGGVAPIPWRSSGAEALLKGRPADDATLHAVANAALAGALPLTHNAYKVPLTKTLVRRAILQAVAGAA